jgi:hypothetical protein
MSSPKITIARKSGAKELAARVASLTKLAAYVGVPASDSRSADLTALLGRATGKKKARIAKQLATSTVNNAELLFIFSKGSPAHNIWARPVLEPAVEADGNRQAIASELAQSSKAMLDGNKQLAVHRMKKAALAGQNAARNWFTDPRNAWAENKPATIAAKGSDSPGIDIGVMRAAIVGITKEE